MVAGEHKVIISWIEPVKPNGRITHYTVHWQKAASGNTQAITRRVDANMSHVTLYDLAFVSHKVSLIQLKFKLLNSDYK